VSGKRRGRGPPSCELCQYQYSRRKKFALPSSSWRYPEISPRDRFLHVFFVLCVFLMIASSVVTIACFKEVSVKYKLSILYTEDRTCNWIKLSKACWKHFKVKQDNPGHFGLQSFTSFFYLLIYWQLRKLSGTGTAAAYLLGICKTASSKTHSYKSLSNL